MQINHNRNKSRQDRLKQAKKRFQFDPNKQLKHNQQLQKSIVKHKTSSAMSIMGSSQLPSSIECVDVDSHLYEQKQNLLSKKVINGKNQENQVLQIKTNTQYSSVNPNKNEKFDLEFQNQSSWLANLVDGIQDLYTKPANRIIEISQRQYKGNQKEIFDNQKYKGNLQENSDCQKSSSLASSKYCFSKKKLSFNQGNKQFSKSGTKDLRESQTNKCQKDRGCERKVKSKTMNSKNNQSFHTLTRTSFNLKNQPGVKRTKSKPDIQLAYKQNFSTKKERAGANGNNERAENYYYQKCESNVHKCPNSTPNPTNKKNVNNTPTKKPVFSLSANRKQSAPNVSQIQKSVKNIQQKKQINVQAKVQSKEKEQLKCGEIVQPSDKSLQNKQQLTDLTKQQIKINNGFKARIRKNSALLQQKKHLLIKPDMAQQFKERQYIGGIRKNGNKSQLIYDSNVGQFCKPNNTQNNLMMQTFGTEDNEESGVRVTGRFNQKGKIRHIKPLQADKERKFEYKSQYLQDSSQKGYTDQVKPIRQILMYKQNQQKCVNNPRRAQQHSKSSQRRQQDNKIRIKQNCNLLGFVKQPEQSFKEQRQQSERFNLPKQKIIDIFYKLNPNNQKYLTSELIKKNQYKIFPNSHKYKDRIMQDLIRSIFIELRISNTNFTLEEFVHFMTKIQTKLNSKSHNKIGQIIQSQFSNQRCANIQFQAELRHLNERSLSYQRNIEAFRQLGEKQQTKQSQFRVKVQAKQSQLFAKVQTRQPQLFAKTNRQNQRALQKQESQNTFGKNYLRQIRPFANFDSSYNSFKQGQQTKRLNDDEQSKVYKFNFANQKQIQPKPKRSEYRCDITQKYTIDERLNSIHNKYTGSFSNYRSMNHQNNQKPGIVQLKKQMPVVKQNLSQDYEKPRQNFEIGRSTTSFTRFQIERLQLIKSRNRQLQQKLVTFNNVTNSSVQESDKSQQQVPDRKNYIQQSSEDHYQTQENNRSFIFPVIVQEEEQDRQIPAKEPYLQMNSTAVLEIDQQKLVKPMGLASQLHSQKQHRNLSNSETIQFIYKMSQQPQIKQISRNYDQKPVLKQLQKYRYDKQLFESEPWTARNASQNSWRNSGMLTTIGCNQNKNLMNLVSQQLNSNTCSIIEKLNLKLSKYIQINRLSSSQKILEFNFSQLRKNLKI